MRLARSLQIRQLTLVVGLEGGTSRNLGQFAGMVVEEPRRLGAACIGVEGVCEPIIANDELAIAVAIDISGEALEHPAVPTAGVDSDPALRSLIKDRHAGAAVGSA
jgi:hypothetical protein